jgi:serine/threonine protein kinase
MDLHNTSNSGTNAIEDGGAASSSTTATSYNGSKKDTLSAVLETNIMMPVDLLSDDRHLYSIMPYCNGGELFERLDKSERFTEAEARYWMAQILNVRRHEWMWCHDAAECSVVCRRLSTLTNRACLLVRHLHLLRASKTFRTLVYVANLRLNVLSCMSLAWSLSVQLTQRLAFFVCVSAIPQICHRDMSLENLLVHESGALIIDLGMCLKIPEYDDDDNDHQPTDAQLTTELQHLSMTPSSATTHCNNDASQERYHHRRRRRRHLILPQGTCGKWIYMSPEIFKNKEAFDGFAVDLWATGVILFLMLTGFPPWERACSTDERFKYMSAGYLVQMLTEWKLGLTADAMDLLQRMLFLDPKDRLSLEQVRHHPWMMNGLRAPPRNVSDV